jgi:hypothetical protein
MYTIYLLIWNTKGIHIAKSKHHFQKNLKLTVVQISFQQTQREQVGKMCACVPGRAFRLRSLTHSEACIACSFLKNSQGRVGIYK